ncbi:fungal pheromone mating factor STE2 GPCR-domain-containing protein [Lipomyces kononenkoae]|uniref:Fungal pheromone mating factor STE2 GPCR-domain-containing protein n=1 Tax=Lipomyces kononenkoae TaxID=34357 RepID=A0ACC3TAJ8_LIPKO
MSQEEYVPPADYTAVNQPLNIMYDGSTTTISATDVDVWMRDSSTRCTVFAVHIGSAAITAIILALLTKPSKRKTPVFILNEICLFLIVLRAGLYINYVLGPFNTFGAFFSGDYSQVPFQAYVRSAVTSFLQLLITLGVELSLLFQVRIVFDTHRNLQRIVTALCSVLVVIVLAFWLIAIIQNIQQIMQTQTLVFLAWAWTAARVLYAASISIFSGIFCFKLVLAIRQRRVLGLTEFGPLQVIVIMSTQTMIVPAIVTIVELATSSIVLAALPSLLVVISLPLSALWASATNDAIGALRRSGNGSNLNNVNMSGGTNSTQCSDHYMFKNTTTSTSGGSSTNIDLEKQEDYQYRGPAVTVTRTIVAE